MGKKLFNSIQYCQCCGLKILAYGYNQENRITHIMQSKGLCYECAFWQDLIDYPPKYFEVVNDRCLRIHPAVDKKEKTIILGGKGKMRYFMRPDSTLFQSNDVWLIGEIPKRFKNLLQSTATEITFKAYKQLKLTNKKCLACACFDRYHCYRYDLAQEQNREKPYNSIPKKWKIGDEHCKFFINKKEILNDDSSVK